MKYSKALICVFALGLAGLSNPAQADENPNTLTDAINNALKLNEVTRSTDELLDAVHYSTLAVKVSNLPSGEFSCSTNLSQSSSRSSIITFVSNDFSRQCGVSVGMTVFDGGAHHAEYEAAKASEAALINLYNTADKYTRNTRGGLAYSALQAFTLLQTARAKLEMETLAKEVLEAFAKTSSDPTLAARIQDSTTKIENLISSTDVLVDNFQYIIKLAPGDHLETMDETIGSLKIPATSQEATDKALIQGPTVVGKNAEVNLASYNLKAIKARLGPSLSIGANISRGESTDRFRLRTDNSSYTSKSVGLTLRIPFSASSRYSVEAAKHELKSKELERDAALQEAAHQISTIYKTLANDERYYLALSKNYAAQQAVLKQIIADLAAGKSTGLDSNSLLQNIGIFEERYYYLAGQQQSIIDNLYSIRQITGLLFDPKSKSVAIQ